MTETTGYSRLQVSLHWVIAALVLFQLLFGESMAEAIEAAEEGEKVSGSDLFLSGAHYWVGIAILVLVTIRLGIRLWQGAPAATAPGEASWMDRAATAMHWLFYALLFAVPVSGLAAIYVSDEIGDLHALAKPVFIVLILAHAGAALYHQFVLKDGTLRRMLVPGK